MISNTMPSDDQPAPPRPRPRTPRGEWAELQISALELVHPALAQIEVHHPSGYLARDLTQLSPRDAEQFALLAPVWVVRTRGAYLRIAGNRTYALVRAVLGPQAIIPVCVLGGRLSPDDTAEIACFGVLEYPLLSSLDASGAHQIDSVARNLNEGYHHDRPGRPPLRRRAVTTAGSRQKAGSRMTRARLAALTGCHPSTLSRGYARRRRA